MDNIKAVIFLAEDNDVQVQTITEAAKVCLPNCLFKIALNGKDLLRILPKAPPPNIIVTDWAMPVLSGQDVIRSIRSHHEYDGLPIVVFSSDASAETRRQALQVGATALVAKPIGWDSAEQMGIALVEIVRKYAIPDSAVRPITTKFIQDSAPTLGVTKTVDEVLAEEW